MSPWSLILSLNFNQKYYIFHIQHTFYKKNPAFGNWTAHDMPGNTVRAVSAAYWVKTKVKCARDPQGAGQGAGSGL